MGNKTSCLWDGRCIYLYILSVCYISVVCLGVWGNPGTLSPCFHLFTFHLQCISLNLILLFIYLFIFLSGAWYLMWCLETPDVGSLGMGKLLGGFDWEKRVLNL